MPSLLTDVEKSGLHSAMKNLAETWEQDIIVYHSPAGMVVSSDPNFNIYQANDQNIFNPTNEPIIYRIKARILYNKDQANPLFDPYVGGLLDVGQLKQTAAQGLVRIKVNESGYNIMKDAKTIQFDNFLFTVDKLERPHGLFNRDYFTFYLKRST